MSCYLRSPPNIHEIRLSESTCRHFCAKVNWFLFKFYEIASGKDLTHFLLVCKAMFHPQLHCTTLQRLIDILECLICRQSHVFGCCQLSGIISVLWAFRILVTCRPVFLTCVLCLSCLSLIAYVFCLSLLLWSLSLHTNTTCFVWAIWKGGGLSCYQRQPRREEMVQEIWFQCSQQDS